MKKTLSILFASALISGFVSCGQSEEDRKADSMLDDTLAKETDATADMLIDSMMRADSLLMVENQRIADSTKNADSLAALKK